MEIVDFFYFLCCCFIGTYKWIEFQIFRMFRGTVEGIMIREMKKIGVELDIKGKGGEDVKILGENKTGNTGMKTLQFKAKDSSCLLAFANKGFMGLGKNYMEGLWECEDKPELIRRIFRAELHHFYLNLWNRFLFNLEFTVFNLQTRARSLEVAQKHYDLGNDLYEGFLDPWMQYTCGYWADATNLNDAQVAKMDLIARKLKLEPGMRVLDLGCGWGTLCKYLAQNYGVECVGVNISKEGVAYGRKINEGLPVDIRLQDYRDMNEKFDRVVSVGLCEHVGVKNYKTFFEVANRCLKDDGICLIHTIGVSDPSLPQVEPFACTYIFPYGMLPYDTDLLNALSGTFILEDWHNFGADYAKTLAAWSSNFNKSWPSLQDKYGKRFGRMWNFYLDAAQGYFLSRKLQLWQLVLTKKGLEGGYRSTR